MTLPVDGDTAAFTVGDQVVALYSIGLFRARVARGTVGVVAGFSPAYDVEVRFSNGCVELVRPDNLAGCPGFPDGATTAPDGATTAQAPIGSALEL